MSITPSEIKRLCRIDSDEICSCVSLWLLSHGMRSIADVTAAALDGRIDSLEGELFSQTLSATGMTSHLVAGANTLPEGALLQLQSRVVAVDGVRRSARSRSRARAAPAPCKLKELLRHCAEGENEAVIETSHEILKNNLIQV